MTEAPTYVWTSESHQRFYHLGRSAIRGDNEFIWVPACTGIRFQIAPQASTERINVPTHLQPCPKCLADEIARGREKDRATFVRIVNFNLPEDYQHPIREFLRGLVDQGWPPAIVWWCFELWGTDWDTYGHRGDFEDPRNGAYVYGMLRAQLDRQRHHG